MVPVIKHYLPIGFVQIVIPNAQHAIVSWAILITVPAVGLLITIATVLCVSLASTINGITTNNNWSNGTTGNTVTTLHRILHHQQINIYFLDFIHLYATNTTTFIQQNPIAYMFITRILYIYTTQFSLSLSLSCTTSLGRFVKKKSRRIRFFSFFGDLFAQMIFLTIHIVYTTCRRFAHIKQRNTKRTSLSLSLSLSFFFLHNLIVHFICIFLNSN